MLVTQRKVYPLKDRLSKKNSQSLIKDAHQIMDALTTNYVLLRVQAKGRYKHETIADYLPKEVFTQVKLLDEDSVENDKENHPYIAY